MKRKERRRKCSVTYVIEQVRQIEMTGEVKQGEDMVWIRGKTGHIFHKGKHTGVIDSSITSLLVLQHCYRNPTNRPPPSRQLLSTGVVNRLDMKEMAKEEGKK